MVLYKLKRCGEAGQLLSLMRSFLKNRKQQTVLNGQCSNWGDILAGVPQGSILGPLLFLIGIGLLKYLSKYLPRHTLNELYKLYVLPHLVYGDVIYHNPAKVCEFSQNIILPNLMEKLEAVQYSAALAVTGTWRGTSCEKLNAELGWESLRSRSWSRRMTLF